MKWKNSGKYWRIDLKKPYPLAMCDHSLKVVPHHELVKQYEWRGNQLVWTGLMVHYTEVDTPNPGLRPPKPGRDMKPIKNPRPIVFNMDFDK
jgi:hypothetical protein